MKINIDFFVKILEGGIPKDRITMIVGSPGSGKSMWMANHQMNMTKLKNDLRIKKLNSL
jgi:KaiC/GvpD/RAD55 family RecA-like ATPase